MKYQAYEEYKGADLGWLNQIPNHWEIKRLKYLGDALIGLTYSPDDVVNDEGEGVLVLRSSNVQNKQLAFDDNVYVNKKVPSKLVAQKGDILLCARNGSRALIGKNAQIDDYAAGMTFGAFMSIFRSPYNDYLSKVFNSPLFESQSGSFLTATINQLTTGNLKGFEIPLPPELERKKIANFLDHETAKIDTLIEKQQQLIKLLKEKRQAVISHAVTKGLNPNAPMRDSGVEWLGEVPEHWEVKQAKYIAEITRGAILRPVDAPEYFDEDGEWAYLNISDATKCDKYLYESKLRLSSLGSTKSARVYPNNVIITASATIGKAFINKIKVCVHDGFIPFCSLKIDRNYLYHYLSNPFLYAAMGKSNTQKNIYLDEVKNMDVTIPSNNEQLEIVKYIESSAATFNKLIQQAEIAIKLMQERRTALISAAVTGKIDVRNWQPVGWGEERTPTKFMR